MLRSSLNIPGSIMYDIERSLIAYIHFPFCRKRCSYCDFLSFDDREERISRYLEILKEEIRLKSSWETVSGRPVESIYIGGGTPSLIPPHPLAEVLSLFGESASPECEITVEINPESATEEFLRQGKDSGVNRLSIGVQSLNSEVLKTLGRIHSAEEAREVYFLARKCGFENLSIDLIFGCPGETFQQWQESLVSAVSLAPEHISTYSLTLEEGVSMLSRIESGELPEVDEDLNADKFDFAIDHLTASGYEHYEISNFCKPGFHSRHNWHYWGNGDYIGLGCGGYSYLNGERFRNTDDIDEYLRGDVIGQRFEVETTTASMGLRDDLFFGLRRIQHGVDLSELVRKRGEETVRSKYGEIQSLVKEGLLEKEGQRVRLTRRGLFLADEILMRLL